MSGLKHLQPLGDKRQEHCTKHCQNRTPRLERTRLERRDLETTTSKEPSPDQDSTAGEKRSHHTRRTCPVCNKLDTNLKKHLQSHARQGHISPDAIGTILSISIRQQKERGSQRIPKTTVSKGLRMKWCPFKDCDYVTHYLRSHLTHRHRVTQGQELENYLRLATPYRGDER